MKLDRKDLSPPRPRVHQTNMLEAAIYIHWRCLTRSGMAVG